MFNINLFRKRAQRYPIHYIFQNFWGTNFLQSIIFLDGFPKAKNQICFGVSNTFLLLLQISRYKFHSKCRTRTNFDYWVDTGHLSKSLGRPIYVFGNNNTVMTYYWWDLDKLSTIRATHIIVTVNQHWLAPTRVSKVPSFHVIQTLKSNCLNDRFRYYDTAILRCCVRCWAAVEIICSV